MGDLSLFLQALRPQTLADAFMDVYAMADMEEQTEVLSILRDHAKTYLDAEDVFTASRHLSRLPDSETKNAVFRAITEGVTNQSR
jgi:hypothetical protein